MNEEQKSRLREGLERERRKRQTAHRRLAWERILSHSIQDGDILNQEDTDLLTDAFAAVKKAKPILHWERAMLPAMALDIGDSIAAEAKFDVILFDWHRRFNAAMIPAALVARTLDALFSEMDPILCLSSQDVTHGLYLETYFQGRHDDHGRDIPEHDLVAWGVFASAGRAITAHQAKSAAVDTGETT